MECEEIRVDMRLFSDEDRQNAAKLEEQLFRLNHTMKFDPEYNAILKEIFGDNLGDNSVVSAPIYGLCVNTVKIGKGVYINSNCLMMARGGITIEDGVQIAANTQILTNNHDLYDLQVLTCKPVLIKENAWIGAGATILPGVCVGKHAVVGACSVVTKDVPDYGVVVGNPAKLIKTLDEDRFQS